MRRNLERYMECRHLSNDMCRSAEGAIRVVNAVRVGMGNLNGSADNDQHDTQQREKESPRTLRIRFWSLPAHNLLTITHLLAEFGELRGCRRTIFIHLQYLFKKNPDPLLKK